MSINTYGVTPDTIKLYASSMVVDPRSGLEAQIEAFITEAGAIVHGEARAAGVSTTLADAADPTFAILKGMVVMYTLDTLAIARNKGADNDLTYRKRYEDLRATLRMSPSRIEGGDGKPDNLSRRAVTPESTTTQGGAALIRSLSPKKNGQGHYW